MEDKQFKKFYVENKKACNCIVFGFIGVFSFFIIFKEILWVGIFCIAVGIMLIFKNRSKNITL